MDIIEKCDLSGSIKADDVVEIKRIGTEKPGIIRPLLVKLSEVEKKKSLFRKLGAWRAKLEADEDRNPLEKIPHIDHDFTAEQRKEHKSLVEYAKEKQAELPKDSPFRIRVRGAPEDMKVVKIHPQGKWEVLDLSLPK